MAEYGQQQQQWQPAQTGPAPPYGPPGQQTYIPGQAPPPGHYAPQGTVLIQQTPAPQTVVVLGGCPTCRVGQLDDEFTCLG
ncbi:unnamed protein product [Medioppia subpectinata]|uniref:Brain protein I3 n=1 Tax=Medioppia subpectinata TaxID=1979941 RepID=A0A7R9KVY6_9ACAR|nr:unnamed protein product [Medioppia subpectinata]CAD7630454.1 unnamed protein product [Medioppia subpectinata]CAG2110882.1 unnamed protein product [Medioppia subpectinata]CAG2110884.1 unnamed protein product [Medioppia subpectinata]